MVSAGVHHCLGVKGRKQVAKGLNQVLSTPLLAGRYYCFRDRAVSHVSGHESSCVEKEDSSVPAEEMYRVL